MGDHLSQMKGIYSGFIAKMEEHHEKQLKDKDQKIADLEEKIADQKKEIEELRANSFYDENPSLKPEIEDLQHDKAASVRVLSCYTVGNAKLKAEFNSLKAILDRLRQALPGNN